MRINTKDLISGGIILLVALVGLWLNQDHSLGTARRMGPGYMPMLALSLLGALGALVFVLGLFSGPDPLSAWTRLDVIAVPFGVAAFFIGYLVAGALGSTGWYTLGFALLAGTLALSVSPGWRPLGLVHAGMALFGLMLEPFGLMLSIAVAVAVSSLAEPHHRPKGVLLMILFLCVLCYAVFIYELDIRVPVWPVFLTQ